VKKSEEKPTHEDVLALRMLVRAYEDFQGIRKGTDNRIGRKADGTAQNVAARAFKSSDLESFISFADVCAAQEEALLKQVHQVLKRFPIYNDYLKGIDGVGEIASAHIISNFDIEKATTVSKMWQFAGLNPGMVNGKKSIDKKDYKEAMGPIVAEYAADPKKKNIKYIVLTDTQIRGDKLTPGFLAPYNADLRTALVGVMADGFIMSAFRWPEVTETQYNNTPEDDRRIKDDKFQVLAIKPNSYAQFYHDYKNRLAREDKWKDESAGHRDRSAKRYMVKMFIKNLYVAWRTIEGLPVRAPYQEEYLEHKHSA